MIELPDDELDKLFRKSSEELDPDYEPKDWNALSKRLDREDGKTTAGWLRKWWPVGILVLLIPAGLGGYYRMNNAGSNKADRIQNVNVNRNSSISVAPHVPADTKSIKESKNESDQKEALLQSEAIANNETAKNTVEKNNNTEKNTESEPLESGGKIAGKRDGNKTGSSTILPRSRFKTGGVYLNPDRSKGKEGNGAFSSSKNKSENNKKAGIENNITEDLKEEGISGKRDSGKDVNSAVQIGQNNKTNVNNYNNSQPVLHPDTNSIQEGSKMLISAGTLDHLPFSQMKLLQFPAIELSKISETAEPSKPAKSQEPYPKMAVRFGYSPDLSTVGFKNFSKPGSAVSLMIEYALMHKLYLQAGVVRSVKVYNAKAREYEWPSDWKPQEVYPTSVDGTCKMFEIPLNLRYDIIQNDRSRWFAGAGVSSYYMGNEKYIYNYPEHTYGDIWRDYETKTGWYWLSHVNASVGYERKISKNLSLLAEPYVKIPLKKVGYGKIDLLTIGMWLSIRYTPVFK